MHGLFILSYYKTSLIGLLERSKTFKTSNKDKSSGKRRI